MNSNAANSDFNDESTSGDPNSDAAATNTNDAHASSVEEEEQQQQQVVTLQHELARVEEGLAQQRGILFDSSLENNANNAQQSGRAIFESLGSALGSIRTRLHGMMSTTTTSGSIDVPVDASTAVAAATTTTSSRRQSEALLTSLSQRLDTAERAHSTRMPLNLLQRQQQQQPEEGTEKSSHSVGQEAAQSMAATRSLSSGAAASRTLSDNSTMSENSINSSGSSSNDNKSDDGDAAFRNKRRRSSALMASRRHLDVHERQDVELHEGTAAAASVSTQHGSSPFPNSIPEEQSEEMRTESQEKEEDDTPDQVELLLPSSTHKQLHNSNASSHSLTGSLRVLSRGTSMSALDTTEQEDEPDMMGIDGEVAVPSPPIPPKQSPTYPPLYVWGSVGDQNSSKSVSTLNNYDLFGDTSSVEHGTFHEPTKLPPQSRLGRSDIVSMSVSKSHMAFSTSSGRVLICGDNHYGAVDPSQKATPFIPRPMHLEILAMNRILKVSCGEDHTAALTETSSVLTWGSNHFGQLGHRVHPTTHFVRPAAFVFAGRASDIACGDGFTMVLTTRMEVYFSGREEITGYNAMEEREKDASPLLRLPEQIAALQGLPLVHVAAGSKHAVVVTAHGTTYALGCNDSGQCGRGFPKQLHVPVPIAMPRSEKQGRVGSIFTTSTSLPNWDVWTVGESISLANDVNVVHAACGKDHTILVTKSGSLFVCGSNSRGQLGIPNSNESTSIQTVQVVHHPDFGRKFVSAEAGVEHSVLMDDAGNVWQMGAGKSAAAKLVFKGSNCAISGVAAGGSLCLAVGKKQDRMHHAPSLESQYAMGLDELVEAIRKDPGEHNAEAIILQSHAPADELARRAEELFRSPSVLNSQFMNPNEIEDFYEKLIDCGQEQEARQKVVSGVEKGMKHGLVSLREARLIYPEAVRFLLLLVQCPLFRVDTDSDDRSAIPFDARGDLIVLLCETMLGLPFEGYKALMSWASTIYGADLFVPFLVRPLVFQLNKRLSKQQSYGVPMIAGVLRWLLNVSEQSESELAKSEDFHCDGIEELPMEVVFEDLTRFHRSTKADRSANFYLCNSAFLMSPTVKRNLLQVEHQFQMVHAAQSGGVSFNPTTREFLFQPYFVLAIDRKYILQQTLQAVASAAPTDLKKSLKVVFKGEDGVDAGGVTKEFFQLLIQKLFDINTGMWKIQNDHEYWFNSDCTWNDDGFYLVGVLVGLAFYNSVLLDVHFPHAVYRKLLGEPLGMEDLVDKDVRNGLKSLLEYEGEDVEDMFCLNFEVSWTVLGEERKKELKDDGANVPVTSSNKEEYVMLYVKWLLMDSVQPQYADFERGFIQVAQGSSFDLLSSKELELLVVGTPDLDFVALEKAARYEGGFDGSHSAVKNLWRWVQSASRETQLKFLKFCTGSNKAPIGGLGRLPFLIQRAGPDSAQLPTAHTCFNTLILPDYGENYDKLALLLGRAVLECEGFGLQ